MSTVRNRYVIIETDVKGEGFNVYFVNRSEIEQTLTYIDSLLIEVDYDAFETEIEKLGLERLVHTMIESIIDVGNMMIDGFIMRDPGSYHDIIDILIDEKVIPSSHEKNYKQFIDLRQMLVQDYIKVNHELLHESLLKHQKVLMTFSKNIRTYLKNELDVANAFSNEDEE